MIIFLLCPEGKTVCERIIKIEHFLERNINAVWWCPKQQPARHAAETSQQRTPLFPAEFLNIIFCIFLQMTQSPRPSPLIPPNYHFSSMSPRPPEMGCLGSFQILPWNVLICVDMCEGFYSQTHTYRHIQTVWIQRGGCKRIICSKKETGDSCEGYKAALSGSLSLILPESFPFFPFASCCCHSCSSPTALRARLGPCKRVWCSWVC